MLFRLTIVLLVLVAAERPIDDIYFYEEETTAIAEVIINPTISWTLWIVAMLMVVVAISALVYCLKGQRSGEFLSKQSIIAVYSGLRRFPSEI